MLRRARMISLAIVIVSLALSSSAAVQTWITLNLADSAEPLELAGSDLASALPATALGVGGIALALFFARRVLVYIVSGLLVILALVQVSAVLQGMQIDNPVIANAAAVATGLQGSEAVVVDQRWLWPAVAIAGAVLAAVAAAFAAATVHRWPTAAKKADRYDMRSGALAWDALDDGDDPTLDDDDSRKTE